MYHSQDGFSIFALKWSNKHIHYREGRTFIKAFWLGSSDLSGPSDMGVLIYQGLLTWQLWFIRAFWHGSSDLSGPSNMGVLIYQGLLTWQFWFIRDFWHGSSDLSGPSDMGVLIYQGLLTWQFWFIRAFWHGSSDLSGTSDFFMEKFRQQVIYSFMSAEFRNVAEYIHVYEDFLTWHTSVKQIILTSYSFINISKNIWLLLLKDLNQPLTHKLNS